MPILVSLKSYFSDENAAITVDWVVLTAAIVGIAIGVGVVTSSVLKTSADPIYTSVSTHVAAVLP